MLVLIVFVSGEEIGWRGFIQNRAIERFGSAVGVMLLGIVWGLWHLPVALRGYCRSQVEGAPAQVPGDASFYGVSFDDHKNPNAEGVEKAAQSVVMIRIKLC